MEKDAVIKMSMMFSNTTFIFVKLKQFGGKRVMLFF